MSVNWKSEYSPWGIAFAGLKYIAISTLIVTNLIAVFVITSFALRLLRR